MRNRFLSVILVGMVALLALSLAPISEAQRRHRAEVCFDPTAQCRTTATFQPYDLPFRVPKNTVIYDTELFYVVMLKRVRLTREDCDRFVSEEERLRAQELFPRRKVFASRRCADAGEIGYFNPNGTYAADGPGGRSEFMAVYAGKTRAEAERMLAEVRQTGKFPGANLRQLRAGFNGT